MDVVDEYGRRLVLSLLGSGGEGTVYRVHGREEVAKIWHTDVQQPAWVAERRQKLRRMIYMRNERVAETCTWPMGVVLDTRHQLVGYRMRPLPAGTQPIESLLSRDRRIRLGFPWNSFRFLCVAAARLVWSVRILNDAGVLVADLNPANLHVSANGTVTLIDTDSFEFSFNGEYFPNRAVRPEFLAPELIGNAHERKTVDHDCFGVAVVIFKLLFQGASPFHQFDPSGTPLDDHQATRQGRLVLSVPERDAEIPYPEVVGPRLLRLFRQSLGVGPRPALSLWSDVLRDNLSRLVDCSAVPAHAYDQGLRLCPWCQHANDVGFDYFV